ncbi:type II secretion system F family protein [Candidatus Parcubacteria bacterium]|nr:MAG: type II secretion system F family protein [Candidatus Parcubacteria bacterium]
MKKIWEKIKNFVIKYQGVPASQKIFFVQQLGVMIRTGISLSAALTTLNKQASSGKFKRILTDVKEEVEKGNLLSKGLERYSKIFGELFINMIKAGETSGKLEEVLKQLYIQMKKDHEIMGKVKGALIYPSIVIVMMCVIGILMMIYVIPSITGIFEEVNAQLPLMTRILISISKFITHNGILTASAAVLLITGFVRFITWPKGKFQFHKLLLKTPIAGKIIVKVNLARLCRTLSSLLKTDIPIVQTFSITSQVLGNMIYRQALEKAKEQIKKGVSIEECLNGYPKLFPPVFLQMVAVGEDTGSLDDILEESAIFYEDEVSQTMSNLPSIIEPVLMVILGIGVAAMAVAVIMPMYSLSQTL